MSEIILIFQTERLLLRELAPEDAAALNAIDSDERVTRFVPFDPQTLEESREFIAAAMRDGVQEPRTAFELAMVLRSSSEMIGRCGLRVSRPEHQEGYIWYMLNPAHWGRGYATEAASALLDFAFDRLRLHRVWADCDPRNVASCRVAERLGMIREGLLRENYWLKGEWCSSAVYAILQSERGAQRKDRVGQNAQAPAGEPVERLLVSVPEHQNSQFAIRNSQS